MLPADRTRLTAALREHVALIAADLRAKMRAPGPARTRAEALHADEQVAEDFDVWTDLLSRRAAVLWVLKSVYVRVLEDRGLLRPGRLFDPEAQQLFERLAPNLGETAFLRWIYRDLASPAGGVPELFSPQAAEVAAISDERSRALIAFWRHRDADTGASWSFADERFEGELMGDLYQELDPVVKDRFALCQTPDFVRAFILDRTLTPAIEAFGANAVRLLDPACGSGHFLIDGLKRLVDATAAQHPGWPRAKVVAHALDRVVGIDLNDYACALARVRLVMTAAELAGVSTLAEAAQFHPHVYWADGLEQVERDESKPALQYDLFEKVEEKPRAVLTRSDVRAALKKVLADKFHAVVANPPYIVERDDARKAYHREMIGKHRRYVSAAGKYSLASPFTERCFQLAEKDGFVGLITSNNFMKRTFGKALIEEVLGKLDLTLVVDTSQAYIPFHGTPTVLLFGRNRRGANETVRAVMGKRGESGVPENPAKGRVWSSIVEGWNTVGFENEFVSVAELPRETLGQHPWSLGGGGAAELKAEIEARTQPRLGMIAESIGITSFTLEDDAFISDSAVLQRQGVGPSHRRTVVEGESLRDWAMAPGRDVVFPYDEGIEVLSSIAGTAIERWLLPYKTRLANNKMFGGRTKVEDGLKWYEFGRLTAAKLRTPLSIAFAEVATHNHFVLDRGGKVFKQTAPVIKLPAGATDDEHLALLGLLNSSTASFWMKQVFHNKGSQGINEGMKSSPWEQFYQLDSTKMKLFPVSPDLALTTLYAKSLDELARARTERSIPNLLASWRLGGSPNTAATLREALDARRAQDKLDLRFMIGLQEELDWLCYRLYGLDDSTPLAPPHAIDPTPPTWLPWCLNLAERDLEIRGALAVGDDPGELPTVWFERHRWEPLTELPPEAPASLRRRVEARRARIAEVPALALIETANFKRRWYRPDYADEEHKALREHLADRVEEAARERGRTFTLEQMVAALQDDPRVLAVCEVLTGRPDFSLAQLVEAALAKDAVPNHPAHVYKYSGLTKRGAWERTWEDQRREDAGESVTPEVPPSYKPADFLKTEYWQLRGKLDVPKERFIAFTEVPGRAGAETLYGWAGWTPLARIKAMLAIDEELEDAGVSLSDRAGLLDGAWRLLPDVAREDPAAATRLKAELAALVGPTGPSPQLLEDWRTRFPPPTTRAAKKPKAKKAAPKRKARKTAEDPEAGESA